MTSYSVVLFTSMWMISCPVHVPEGPMGLLQLKQVHVELKLSDEQVAKIEKRMKEIQEEVKKLEKSKRFPQLIAGVKDMAKNELTPEQHKRLSEIQHQIRGVKSFLHPDTAAELKLTEKQAETAKKLTTELTQETFKAVKELKDEPEKVKAALEIRAKHLQTMLSQLDDEQKAKWKKLIGATFELDTKACGCCEH